MTSNVPANPHSYETLLAELKARIRNAQVKTALSVNRDLVLLYWSIGPDILERQAREGWGSKVIDRLAKDLSQALPDSTGFSSRNLKYMRKLAGAYPDEQFVQQFVAQIPWGHHVRLLDMVADPSQREWYIRQVIQNGWSRAVLVHQIESKLYARQGKGLTNFDRTLPPLQSDLAQQLIKDPYSFDSLPLGRN